MLNRSPLRVLAVVLSGGIALWLLFHFVISDDQLLLDYLKALVWPLVILGAMFWLRDPLRQKVGQLLRVEAFGTSAEFAGELQQEVASDVDALTAVRVAIEQGDFSIGVGTPESSVVRHQVRESEHSDASQTGSTPPAPGNLEDSHREDLLTVLTDLSTDPNLIETIQAALQSHPEEGRRLVHDAVRHEAARIGVLRKQLTNSREQNRESVENIIQKSASWGYEMGRAGAPKAVPDIEWREDGTWSITTEVPSKSTAPRVSAQVSASLAGRRRGIERLESEIFKAQRDMAKLSPYGNATMAMLTSPEGAYLQQLKRQLRQADPGNPIGQD
jgi:hypothetical protein